MISWPQNAAFLLYRRLFIAKLLLGSLKEYPHPNLWPLSPLRPIQFNGCDRAEI
jgi:hypothetical protein